MAQVVALVGGSLAKRHVLFTALSDGAHAHAQTHARRGAATICVNVRPDLLSFSLFLFLTLSLSYSRRRRVTHGRHAALDNKLERNGETPIPRVLAQGKRHNGGSRRINEDLFAVFARVSFAENQREVIPFFVSLKTMCTGAREIQINRNRYRNTNY